jgi:hypothetical protein
MALPDFFVIGAPKAGTTALHAALAPHPQLFMSRVKEPRHFLTDGVPPPSRGGPGDAQTYQEYVWRRRDYEALFAAAPAGALKGESSPFYLWSRDAHRRIRRAVPDAKLIAMLRDPVERAHSNWSHLWSAGLEPYADFCEACAREPDRIEAGWAPFWRYVDLGKYGEQLQALLEVFPREQLLVLRYRDMRDRPGPTLDRVCEFLGVQTGQLQTVPHENIRTHVQSTPVTRAIQAGLRGGAQVGHLFPLALRRAVRGPFLHLLHRRVNPRPRLSADDRATVLRYFMDDLRLLHEVTGDDYSDWLSANAGGKGALLAERLDGGLAEGVMGR